jgi:membrane-associated phospholipid phosphatase
MDIDYLLLLQDFRNGINNAITPFMEMISLFAVTYLVIVPAMIYWCVDKRVGLFTIGSYAASVTVNAMIKLSCCIYRPWIRDARVMPAGDAITTATGYSFPSGHTMTAVPIYGGLAVSTWKKMRWASVLCLICLALTAFSRNYLGVHTPQDVLVGILTGSLVLWGMYILFRWLDQHPEKENWFLLGGVVFCIGALIYFSVKEYPMDYVDGKLLVDPQKMMNDGYGDLAFLIAFCIGRYIERRWIRFKPTGINAKGIIVCAVGMVIFVLLNDNIGAPLDQLLGSHWGHFMRRMITILYYTALYPLIIRLAMEKTGSKDEENS